MLLDQVNTLDDRREIWHLMHRLPPGGRVAYLEWCCRQTRRGAKSTGSYPVYSREQLRDARRCDDGDQRLTTSCYTDWLALVGQKGLDPVAAAVELERRVKAATR